jgi:hypothetical protein
MSVKQLEKEMSAVGLVRVRTVETLPLQHIVIFEKRNYALNPHRKLLLFVRTIQAPSLPGCLSKKLMDLCAALISTDHRRPRSAIDRHELKVE